MTTVTRAPVFVSRISSSLGCHNSAAIGADLSARLVANGLGSCRVSSRQIAELAADAVNHCLGTQQREVVDLLIYATQTPDTEQTWQLLTQSGLPNVPSVSVTGDACANLAPALRIAANAVSAGDSRSAVVVTADKAEEPRFREFGSTLMSDGAAACLVSSDFHEPSFRFLSLRTRIDAGVNRGSASTAGTRAMLTGLKAAVDEVVADAGDRDFSLFITPNYGHDVRRFLAAAAGMPEDILYAPTAPDVGHCFGADLLLGLDAALEDGLTHGEKVLLVTTSERSWSAMAFEYVVQP